MPDSMPETDEVRNSNDKSREEEVRSSGSETIIEEKVVSAEETMQTEEKRVDKDSDAVEPLEDEASSNCSTKVSQRFRVDRFINEYKSVVVKASLALVKWLVVPLILTSTMQFLGNEKLGLPLRNNGVDVSSFSILRRMEEMEASIKMSIRELQNDLEAIGRAAESMRAEIARSSSRLQSTAVENASICDGLKRLELEIVEVSRPLRVLDGCTRDTAFEKDLPAPNSNAEVLHMTREIVREEVEKHAADGLGMSDYALASGGATILRHSEPRYPMAGANNFTVHPDAIKMLQPSFGEPGQCFSLKGQSGFVNVHLTAEIIPESVTLEHVDGRVAYERQSAPKDCKVSAWHAGNAARANGLANFTYELDGKNRQTFPVDGSSLQSSGEVTVNVVRFEFLSNYGANHTCVYRFRVHGRVPDTALESVSSASGISVGTTTAISCLVVAVSVLTTRRILVLS